MKRIPREAAQDFPMFLKRVRKEQNVLLEQLADGLMSASQLARIEKGERPALKNMRDRLLGRLGIASDLYENLLNIEDHAAWEQERNILCAVERKETQDAQKLIAAYEQQTTAKDKIKQQFCLVMKAEVLKQQKADRGEIGDCYEKAVKLTVPDVDCLCIAGKLLCIQEINMVLEYENYHKGENFMTKCGDLITLVESTAYDNLSKVKIYPKIVYYYLRETASKPHGQTLAKLGESLQICDRAVEMLRDTGRAFYLLELLEIRMQIMESISARLEGGGRSQELEALKQAYEESAELVNLLKSLYAEYDVPTYMQDCAYMYHQRWMFYVGDVLCIRRKMYGLTQKALCEGICSVRTLRRAEKREANMQYETLGVLLRKLGLSRELQRTRLVTNDREVLKLREELVVFRNNRETGKARELLVKIKEKVSGEVPQNRQYFLETEASLDWMEGKITKEELAAREEAALQCTLKVKNLFNIEEIYLTEMEITCIRKRMQGLENTEKRKCIDFFRRFFEWYEKNYTLVDGINIYEFVMVCIINELGSLGEHQLALGLDNKVINESLRCKRIWEIDRYLYEMIWNEVEQQRGSGESVEMEKMTEDLEQCIVFSHFCKKSFSERFYKYKIH